MSSFAYGYVTAKRVVAPSGQSQTAAAPAMTTYIDTLAALVPAEALALYAGIIAPNVTKTVSITGKTATVVSDPTLLSWSCAGLLVLSTGLYIAGRMKAKLTPWDIPRALIPPAAFTGWMLVQNPGVFDVWWHASSTAERVIIAAFTAILLGVLAKALGYQADQAVAVPLAGLPAAGVTGPEQPAEQPAAEQPAAEVPAPARPAAEVPAAEQPAAETLAPEQPAPEQPAAEVPAAEQPAAETLVTR